MLGWLKTFWGGADGSVTYARKLLAQSWEAYRMARRDRPRESNQPHGYSGDSAILGSHDLMNRRVRDQVRNVAQSKGIVRDIVDLVIGTGMQTYSWPFAPSELFQIVTELESLTGGQLGPRLAFALESDDLFDTWANDPDQFDVEGRLNWPEMQRMLVGESVTSGNGLLVRVFRKDYDLPLAWQLLEREQLDESQDRPASPGKNKIVGGLEFDAANRVVAYHVFLDHPHEFFGVSQSTLMGAGAPIALGSRRRRVPAQRVIDLAQYHRPSASLGVSWFDCIGQTTWDRDQYLEHEIRSAAVDAAFAFVAKLIDAEKHPGLGFSDDQDDTDEYDNRQYKMGHSPMAAVIGTDESLEMIRETRPNKDAPSFLRALDRDTAVGTGLSYYTLTGDYAQTNFSSARAAKLDEEMHVRPLQSWFATHAALRIRREFNAVAAASGLFKTLRPAEFRANLHTYQRFDAIGAGRDLLDPFKEGEARTSRLRTGMSTFKEECARRGKHWIRVLMQLAIERKVSQMFGVDLDFSKSGSGASQGQQPSDGQAVSDDQAEQIADRVAMLVEDAISAA